ncbi:sodium- and chloride-dependent glycine transporter 1-like [Mercenaria mercenaria]|uniref:sodium- and chloride-dependent glycine transporter 1-like n=1 Tax=Mercenaria mercenaria TaxID=6596 RepID=UPI00234E5F4D|nr:sodium- and chloride-dependent glycine transporter 1-like [Mercenaria mercenaria]
MELEPLNSENNAFDEKDKLARKRAERNDERGTWGSRFEFLLAIIGFTVGIGSIWRFPILCARNGGGAFLIPFFFFMITCGGPLYYLEVCLGQFSGQSAGAAFHFCPLLRGLGFLMVMISFDILWYYVTIMGWIQYYFVQSFNSQLPWTTCGNWWNTENCKEREFFTTSGVNNSITVNTTSLPYNISSNTTSASLPYNVSSNMTLSSMFTSPANEFWLYNVLRKSDGLENMGTIQWHLVLSNFVGWVIVVASLIKGVQSLGKVVYVTATAPYVLLTVLLIRGLMLDGAIDGVVWYITPDFEKLASPQVWLEAAIQVFYSLGPTYGGVITMASHNKFHQKSIVETTICVASDAFTAFYAGLVVFTCMGFMAKEAGTTVEVAAKASGPGLAFVAYPEALSRMPLPQFWAALFFFMLVTVAFDSTFGMFETVTGALFDIYPKKLMPRKYLVLIGTALVLFVLSLPLTMNGGIFLFQLSDWYISAFALLFGSALECIMVTWIYGADRFAQDIELMTGRKVSKILRIFWCVLMTGFLSITCLITIITYTKPDYGDGYVYQPYSIVIGVLMSLVPFVPVVLIMVKEIWQAEGSLLQRVSFLLQPSEKWGPIDNQAREIYFSKPYRYDDTLCKRIKTNILGDKDTPWF